MGKWSAVGDAKASGDSLPNIFDDPNKHPIGTRGEFSVRVTNVKDVDGRSGDIYFIIEFEILKSTHDDVILGRQYSQVIKFNNDMGPINVKRFILAANGLDPNDEENESQADEDATEYVLGEDQPLTGLEIDLTCAVIKTKRAGTPFTKHTWHVVEGADDSAAADKDAAADPKDVA